MHGTFGFILVAKSHNVRVNGILLVMGNDPVCCKRSFRLYYSVEFSRALGGFQILEEN